MQEGEGGGGGGGQKWLEKCYYYVEQSPYNYAANPKLRDFSVIGLKEIFREKGFTVKFYLFIFCLFICFTDVCPRGCRLPRPRD